MKTISINGKDLVPTLGAIVNGKRIVGLFSTEQDARSAEADNLAVAIVDEGTLDASQHEIAAQNSEEI